MTDKSRKLPKRNTRMLDFIVNAKAGNGKALSEKGKIEKILKERGVKHGFHITDAPKNAITLARKLCQSGATDVIAVGGDGTANEVLNGLSIETANFGIIPCGSGNDFATSANIPKDTEKALEVILNGTPRPTDFLVCDGVRGLNAIGTGIDVDILERTAKNKLLKGKIKYFASLIVSLLKYKFCEFKIKAVEKFCENENATPLENGDDTESEAAATLCETAQKKSPFLAGEERGALIACCGNGKKIGGGIPVCPEAVIDDGKMDLVIVNALNRSRIPGALVKLMKGKILSLDVCDFDKVDHAALEFDKKPPIQIDGEIYYDLNFDVHVEKGKLSLYRP